MLISFYLNSINNYSYRFIDFILVVISLTKMIICIISKFHSRQAINDFSSHQLNQNDHM